jgi:hypothetical protein
LKQNKDQIQLLEYLPQKLIEMKDEYDKNEYKSIFDTNTGVIVKEMLLDCSKTICLKIYAKKQKILFVLLYNRLYLEF